MTLPATTGTASVFSLFEHAARTNARRPWLMTTPETAAAYGIEPGEITYFQALNEVYRIRSLYTRAGYRPGYRVGLLLENRPAFFHHWFALNALGCSIVPLNPDLRILELSYLIGHSDLGAIVAIPSRHAALRDAAGDRDVPITAPDEPPEPVTGPGTTSGEAALLYTSGTTGRPKGCVLPDEYFLQVGAWYSHLGGLVDVRTGVERMLTPLPLFHANALAFSAMAMLATGGCLIPLDRFHPRSWWATVRDARATIIHYLGVMPAILMNDPPDPGDRDHNVRFGFGAGVDAKLHAPFEQRFGFPLTEAWAMTETGAGAAVVAHQEPRHVGTCCFGRLDPAVECRIIHEDGRAAAPDEPGEFLVRRSGPEPRFGFFREYLKDPEATAEAWDGGWFHTGDIVRRSADGSLHFVDRRKNIVRRSGENIAAAEVESALCQHPAIAAVAVAPTADPVRGEEVFACIVVRPPAQPGGDLANTITAWCVKRLAHYKAPGFIAFVPELPLTSTQKIQRGELRALVASVIGTAYDTRRLKQRSG